MVTRAGLIEGITAFAASVDGLETPVRDVDSVNRATPSTTPKPMV